MELVPPTMYPAAISDGHDSYFDLSLQRGRLPIQADGLTFDHRMTRACLHTDHPEAAHNRSACAASSTAAPPACAPRQPWPHRSSADAALGCNYPSYTIDNACQN